ncbi:DUF6012 family protein [Klebsiella aerogenes]|uniref:DUF6012 family protein n=1 Tax=Escherichia coli TaxID=562 RepID=UPI0013D7A0A6|nr:DUF6012 family protein [Escherichia coli]
MYIHIVPKLYHLMANKCSLKSISIPELDFIIDSESLSVGRPWPNKCLWVGMRKGRKSVNGLVLQTDKKLRWFTTIYTWDIEDMGNRVHSAYENKPPARIQPKMESLLNKPGENSHDVWEEFEWGDFLLSREESLLLHTIQSERLSTDCSLFKRQPSIESALVI